MSRTNKPIFGAIAKLKFCFRLLTEMFPVGYRLTVILHILETIFRSQCNSQGQKGSEANISTQSSGSQKPQWGTHGVASPYPESFILILSLPFNSSLHRHCKEYTCLCLGEHLATVGSSGSRTELSINKHRPGEQSVVDAFVLILNWAQRPNHKFISLEKHSMV